MGRGLGAAIGLVVGIASVLLLNFGLERVFRGLQFLQDGQTYLGLGALVFGGILLATLFLPPLPATARILPGSVILVIGLLSAVTPRFVFDLPLIGGPSSLQLAATIPLGLVLIASSFTALRHQSATAADTSFPHGLPADPATSGSVPSWAGAPGPIASQPASGHGAPAGAPSPPQAAFHPQPPPQPTFPPQTAPAHHIPAFESAAPPPTATPPPARPGSPLARQPADPVLDNETESGAGPRVTPSKPSITASQTVRIPLSEIPTVSADPAPEQSEPPPPPPG